MNEMVLRDICETLKGIKGELEKMNKYPYLIISPEDKDVSIQRMKRFFKQLGGDHNEKMACM